MDKQITTYTALTIVSPMVCGNEKKDQDRARWYGPGQAGAVCDGVSSSPDSARAAELAIAFLPSLFNGNTNENLKILCDILAANRQECQENEDISMPDDAPLAMQDMLRKVVRQKRTTSFQTTMVAAKFIPDGNNVLANIIKCGDSAFFAFSPDGQLLSSSMAFASGKTDENITAPFQQPQKISFGPGDEILVRIESALGSNKMLLKQSLVRPEHAVNWLICTAIDSCSAGQDECNKNFLELKALSLNSGDYLLVPKYLHGIQLTSRKRQYLVLRYSSAIKPVLSAPITSLASHSSSTMVLPDHFYCGCYDSFQDRFPQGTNFLLCSDGLYSGFPDWRGLWKWLHENKTALYGTQSQEAILASLHTSLHSKGGDDDISFVWVKPGLKE